MPRSAQPVPGAASQDTESLASVATSLLSQSWFRRGMSPSEAVIRVLVVDDHPLFRAGVRSALKGVDDICVLGDVSNAAQALVFVSQCATDVAVMDLEMPEQKGLEDPGSSSPSSSGSRPRAHHPLRRGATPACAGGRGKWFLAQGRLGERVVGGGHPCRDAGRVVRAPARGSAPRRGWARAFVASHTLCQGLRRPQRTGTRSLALAGGRESVCGRSARAWNQQQDRQHLQAAHRGKARVARSHRLRAVCDAPGAVARLGASGVLPRLRRYSLAACRACAVGRRPAAVPSRSLYPSPCGPGHRVVELASVHRATAGRRATRAL